MEAMEAMDILQKLPAELLPGGESAIKSKFKDLAKHWHPDKNKSPEAERVFEHLKRCRDYLLSGASRSVLLTDKITERKQRYSFISEHRMRDMRVLVGATTVSYLLTGQMAILGLPIIRKHWEFTDDKQRAEMMRFLPEHHRIIDAREGLLVTYHRRAGDALLLDVVDYHKRTNTRIPPLAVMWMISGLLNIACYMEIRGIAHCALREEFLVVNLDKHEVKLEGPPIFACRIGERPKVALAETLRDYPVLRTKDYAIQNSRLDLTLIRSLVMRLLGHRTTRQVRADPEVPRGIADWLESPLPRTAVEDYVAWEKLRGKRAFHIYGLSARDIYVSLL